MISELVYFSAKGDEEISATVAKSLLIPSFPNIPASSTDIFNARGWVAESTRFSDLNDFELQKAVVRVLGLSAIASVNEFISIGGQFANPLFEFARRKGLISALSSSSPRIDRELLVDFSSVKLVKKTIRFIAGLSLSDTVAVAKLAIGEEKAEIIASTPGITPGADFPATSLTSQTTGGVTGGVATLKVVQAVPSATQVVVGDSLSVRAVLLNEGNISAIGTVRLNFETDAGTLFSSDLIAISIPAGGTQEVNFKAVVGTVQKTTLVSGILYWPGGFANIGQIEVRPNATGATPSLSKFPIGLAIAGAAALGVGYLIYQEVKK